MGTNLSELFEDILDEMAEGTAEDYVAAIFELVTTGAS